MPAEEGPDPLLDHLRKKFGEYIPEKTLPPQAINIQFKRRTLIG